MGNLERLQETFSGDQFVKNAGITITAVDEECVVCQMPIQKLHENNRGKVMGGAIFTLADFSASVAANLDAEGSTTITLQANINFLSEAKGVVLYARASRIKKGRNTALHEVEITDELGTKVAKASITGYILHEKGKIENRP